MPGPEHVRHLRGRVELLDVRRMMARQARLRLRLADDEGLVARAVRVLRPRTVADLAADVLQAIDPRNRAAPRLVVAGDVAAHAVEVVLLELPRERVVRVRVRRRVPYLLRRRVASGAGGSADVDGLRA